MDELKKRMTSYLRELAQFKVDTFFLLRQAKYDQGRVSKDEKLSVQARKEGNDLFLGGNHDHALHHKVLLCYNRSAAFAPNGSDALATANGNRSLLLRHIRKYNECVIEIDKALKITKSVPLKVKLLCRKTECYTALGSSENVSCLEKARFISSKSDDSDEVKKKMIDQITQTEAIVDAGELDTPKENRKTMESLRIIAEAEKNDVWSRIDMNYTKKQGRHIVATQDHEPGEVVFVAKPFMNFLDDSKRYLYCAYCINYLWTAFPCDHCSWRVYCSEQCKNQAWNEYHDIECPVLVRMKEGSMLQKDDSVPFLISVFIKAVKEAGGLNELRESLRSIDKCKDGRRDKLPLKKKFKDHEIMYSLKTRKVEGGELEWCLQTSLSALIGLVKYSSMFKAYSNPSNIGSLLKDDSIIFSGTFLLKLFIVITTKYATTDLYDPHEEADVHSRWNPGENTRIPGSMEPLMSCITLAFVAITACNPNIKMILTHTNRYIVYALTPIKKGEPLSTCLECIYLRIPKHKRQAAHQGMFKQPCDCRACVENWSDILDNDAIFENNLKDKVHIAEKMVEEKEWIEAESDARGHRLNWPDPKLISRSKKFVIEAWKHFSMPSPITVEAIRLMIALLSYQHSPRVQDFEREIFCKM